MMSHSTADIGRGTRKLQTQKDLSIFSPFWLSISRIADFRIDFSSPMLVFEELLSYMHVYGTYCRKQLTGMQRLKIKDWILIMFWGWVVLSRGF